VHCAILVANLSSVLVVPLRRILVLRALNTPFPLPSKSAGLRLGGATFAPRA